TPLERTIDGDRIAYRWVACAIDRSRGVAEITVAAPDAPPPADPAAVQAQGVAFWPLAVARELDDLILHLRVNEEAIGLWVLKTTGSADLVEAYDRLLEQHAGHWLVREIRLYLKRTLKRLDVTSRSLFALIEPGSCFAGTLLELALACDRSYMLDGTREGDEAPAAALRLTPLNFGAYPMPNGLSRLASRFLAEPGRGGRQGRPARLRHRPARRVRPEESVMARVDYTERIPNNVSLADNRRLLRALEEWQPRYLDWWNQMGPEGFQAKDVYLRTA